MTIQGLAVARALAQMEITVFAVDRHKNPPTKSKYINMLVHPGVGPEDLPSTLLELRKKIPFKNVVLFPCSDKTVRSISQNWKKLSKDYLLSWSKNTQITESFTNKAVVCRHAEKKGIKFPRSEFIQSIDSISKCNQLNFPVIVKPDSPPGTFKAKKYTILINCIT